MKRIKAIRAKLFKRPHVRCYYCLRPYPKAQMTIDHATPKSVGGTLAMENVRAACRECNGKKGDRTPEEFFDQLVSEGVR